MDKTPFGKRARKSDDGRETQKSKKKSEHRLRIF
jgi:hypothetical protein